MSWPQITMIVLWTIGLTFNALKHGQPKDEKYDFFLRAIGVCIQAALLIAGGFFT